MVYTSKHSLIHPPKICVFLSKISEGGNRDAIFFFFFQIFFSVKKKTLKLLSQLSIEKKKKKKFVWFFFLSKKSGGVNRVEWIKLCFEVLYMYILIEIKYIKFLYFFVETNISQYEDLLVFKNFFWLSSQNC